MDAIFEFYPGFAKSKSLTVPTIRGNCSLHNGLTIHGTGVNMTNGFRLSMAYDYMPDGIGLNGIQNILSDELTVKLTIEDLLNSDQQNH